MFAGTTTLVQGVHCGHMFRIQAIGTHLKNEEQQKKERKSSKTAGKKKSRS